MTKKKSGATNQQQQQKQQQEQGKKGSLSKSLLSSLLSPGQTTSGLPTPVAPRTLLPGPALHGAKLGATGAGVRQLAEGHGPQADQAGLRKQKKQVASSTEKMAAQSVSNQSRGIAKKGRVAGGGLKLFPAVWASPAGDNRGSGSSLSGRSHETGALTGTPANDAAAAAAPPSPPTAAAAAQRADMVHNGQQQPASAAARETTDEKHRGEETRGKETQTPQGRKKGAKAAKAQQSNFSSPKASPGFKTPTPAKRKRHEGSRGTTEEAEDDPLGIYRGLPEGIIERETQNDAAALSPCQGLPSLLLTLLPSRRFKDNDDGSQIANLLDKTIVLINPNRTKSLAGIKSPDGNSGVLQASASSRCDASAVLAQRAKQQLKAALGRARNLQKKDPGSSPPLVDYHQLEPLAALWSQNVQQLLQYCPPQALTARMAAADLHGSIIRVIKSRYPALIHDQGIVVMHCANSFHIVTPKNEIKVLPKNGTTFSILMPPLNQRGAKESWHMHILGEKVVWKDG